MSKKSQTLKTVNPSIEFHSTPVSRTGKIEVVRNDYVSPAKKKKQIHPENESRFSIDEELESRNVKNDYSELTGINPGKPLILQVSNFVPLFEGDSLAENSVYRSLSLKEKSQVLTSKIALSVMDSNLPVHEAAQKNRASILEYADRNLDFVLKLIKESDYIRESLAVHDFERESKNTNSSRLSFVNYLKSKGHSDAIEYSSTKLWQQSLLEFKKDIMFHTNDLLGENSAKIPKYSNVEDLKYRLAGQGYDPNSKKIWITSTGDVDFSIMDIAMSGKKSETSTDQVFSVSEEQRGFLQRQGLNANSVLGYLKKSYTSEIISSKIINLYDALYVNLSQKDTLNNRSKITQQYLKSLPAGHDIALILNCIVKELNYSLMISEKSNEIESNFGFKISSDIKENNTDVWEYIVGKFDPLITRVRENYSKGNSLKDVSISLFSNETSDQKIMNLEREDILLDSSVLKNDLQPGSSYYIDNSFDSQDKKKFDTIKLDSFLAKLKNVDKANDIIDVYAVPSDNDVKNDLEPLVYKNKYPVSPEDMFLYIKNKLSDVDRVYKSCLTSTVVSQSNVVNTLDLQALKNLNTEDQKIRKLAIMCKAMSYPSASVISLPFDRLKARLFVWCIKKCYESLTEASQSNSSINEGLRIDSTEYEHGMRNLFTVDAGSGGKTYDLSRERDRSLFKSAVEDGIIVVGGSTQISTRFQITDDFSVDENLSFDSLLTSSWIDLMKPYVRQIFQEGLISTEYSRINHTAILMAYFDLILRITAGMCPETIKTQFKAINLSEGLAGNWSAPQDKNVSSMTGYFIGIPSPSQITSFYNSSAVNNGSYDAVSSDLGSTSILLGAQTAIKREQDHLEDFSMLINEYVDNLKNSIIHFKSLLETEEAKKFLSETWAVYDKDEDLSAEVKKKLVKMSFSKRQLLLRASILAEYKDRLRENAEAYSTYASIPIASGYTQNSANFFPMDSLSILDFTTLSSFFKSKEWNREIGGNKKILTVGLPVGLLDIIAPGRSQSDNDSMIEKEKLRSLFVVNVYKIDQMNPSLIYKPKQFLFDSEMFSTKVVSNWSVKTLSSNNAVDLLRIPLRNYRNGLVLLDSYEGNESSFYERLSDKEKISIYKNHSMSLLLDQYMKWFTDSNIDETRYYSYGSSSDKRRPIDAQFINFSNLLKKGEMTPGYSIGVIQLPNSEFIEVQSSILKKDNTVRSQKIIPDLTDTVKSYFENNETLMMDPLEIVKRATYPKKFDKVVNIIFDPDDFVIDEESFDYMSLDDKQNFRKIVDLGLLKTQDVEGVKVYKHRDTSERDITFDEYFVTVTCYVPPV